MSYYGKWKPSRSQANEFANKMNEIEVFCKNNNIDSSKNNDSYYFCVNSQKYRVSNHSVESRVEWNDNLELVKKDSSFKEEDVVYIHASKMRIIEIYNNLKNGLLLDGKGKIKE